MSAGTGDGNGSTWDYGFQIPSLQKALPDSAHARRRDTRGGGNLHDQPQGLPEDVTSDPLYEPRTYSFELKNGIRLIGGWRGDEAFGSDPQGDANATILSGEIDDNKTLWSLHVVKGADLNSSTLLEGFLITGGNANGYVSEWESGGGMSLSYSSPIVRNCVFSHNNAEAVTMFEDPLAPPTQRGNRGAGMYVAGGRPRLENCVFADNTTLGKVQIGPNVTSAPEGLRGLGGGMYNDQSSPTLVQCVFTRNSAIVQTNLFGTEMSAGGAICNYLNGELTLKNCIFFQNTAKVIDFDDNLISQSNGAIYSRGFDGSITNCLFWGNDTRTVSGLEGGGVSWGGPINQARRGEIISPEILGKPPAYPGDPNARPSVSPRYQTIQLNGPNIIQGGMDSSHPQFDDLQNVSSIANDQWGKDYTFNPKGSELDPDSSPLKHVMDADPLFVDPDDPDGPDNLWFTEDDGLQLQAGSPAIDAGFDDAKAGYEEIDTEWTADVLGYRRIQGNFIDLGPYESYVLQPQYPLEWSSATEQGGSWKSFDWFGYYYVAFTEWVNWLGYDPNAIKGWIYHADYGWLYRVSPNTDDIWFWHAELGWLWTNQSVFPYLYRADSGDWIYFHPPSTAKWEGHTHADPHDPPPPPVYYDFGTAEWLPLEN